MTADLSKFAPGDAKILLLLRTDRMRRSPHRMAVETLLRHLPDYDTLVSGSTLSPFDDFNALLIATSNPMDVTATARSTVPIRISLVESEAFRNMAGSSVDRKRDKRL